MKEHRFDKLGIKQTIQKHWMDRVLLMLQSGLSETEIRRDLTDYLATQKQSGGLGQRGEKTYKIAIGILSCWFSPLKELIDFRDSALSVARTLPIELTLPLHWAVISASYPFWFNTAWQVGRLFSLQEQVTQLQIFSRLKERYGDRETVARNARYAVRSFVAWSVLNDTAVKGSYRQCEKINIINQKLALLMIEAALHASNGGKGTLSQLNNHPAFFPFRFPKVTADFVTRQAVRIEVVHQDNDDSLLVLKGTENEKSQEELLDTNRRNP